MISSVIFGGRCSVWFSVKFRLMVVKIVVVMFSSSGVFVVVRVLKFIVVFIIMIVVFSNVFDVK